MSAVDSEGVRIAYRREGSGDTVLFLHGGASTHEEWLHQMSALAPSYDVLAWDCPGGGGSGDPGADWDLGDYARCVLGLADALGVATAHVVGLSFGGGLALEVFHQRPGFVRSLVLVSAYAGWAGSLTPDEVAARVDAGPPDPRDLVGPGAPQSLLDEMHRLELQARPTVAVAARAFAAADLRPVLPTIDVPTLVLAGREDRRCPLHVAETLRAGIPGSRLVVVDGAGHCLNLEVPERLTDELRAHLADQ